MTKIDLAEACEFDRDAARSNIHEVRPGLPILETSAKTGRGMPEWTAYLLERLRAHREGEADVRPR